VVVIGGGLAGYAAAIRLLEAGKSCALLSMGQSALHFSSGSLDFLNYLPDGRPVADFREGLAELAELSPGHPYALIGIEESARLALEAEEAFRRWETPLSGSLAQGSHFRLSPIGKLLPTWLSSRDALVAEKGPDGGPHWPYRSVSLVNVEGFVDFYPEIIASKLAAYGLKVQERSFTTPDLEIARGNPSEFRSVNIARVLDQKDNFNLLKDFLRALAPSSDLLLMPACVALNDGELLPKLSANLGKPVKLVPTLAPSLLGARLNRRLARVFLSKGGVLMPKDEALGFSFAEKGSGPARISALFTQNHEDMPLAATHYVLATGGFFSQGLKAEPTRIREAVFDLDLAENPGERAQWTRESVFQRQPYLSFGVKTDSNLDGYWRGAPIANLKVAGTLLGGFDPVRLGCGGGVALVSAFRAARAILSGEGAA
jgi:glycerol-3-phosphate dehydrogenase subunit B